MLLELCIQLLKGLVTLYPRRWPLGYYYNSNNLYAIRRFMPASGRESGLNSCAPPIQVSHPEIFNLPMGPAPPPASMIYGRDPFERDL